MLRNLFFVMALAMAMTALPFNQSAQAEHPDFRKSAETAKEAIEKSMKFAQEKALQTQKLAKEQGWINKLNKRKMCPTLLNSPLKGTPYCTALRENVYTNLFSYAEAQGKTKLKARWLNMMRVSEAPPYGYQVEAGVVSIFKDGSMTRVKALQKLSYDTAFALQNSANIYAQQTAQRFLEIFGKGRQAI